MSTDEQRLAQLLVRVQSLHPEQIFLEGPDEAFGTQGFAMTAVDLTVPATLKWISREISRERPLLTLRDAVKVAMQELRKGEFLTACIVTAEEAYQCDEIVELFQKGRTVARRFALF